MKYSRLHNRVQSPSYEDRYGQITCNIFAEEEYTIQYYQNNTGIPAHYSTRDTQKVEDDNHLSRTEI